MKREAYEYNSLQIPGGGYVTGFLFSEKTPGVFYNRTDIGGCYRFCQETKSWSSLINHITMRNMSQCFPSAMAIPEEQPELLYLVSGVSKNPSDFVIRNVDTGEELIKEIPCAIHGNWSGRGAGNRLIIDPFEKNTLYFASQKDGLMITRDLGDTWEAVLVNGESMLTFVWASPKRRGMLLVGTAGTVNREEGAGRGHSLYISYDGGKSFCELPEPQNAEHVDWPLGACALPGHVAHRICADDKFLYVTFTQNGTRRMPLELGYSCDSGELQGGRVYRYALMEDGSYGEDFEDITPNAQNKQTLAYGFGGVDTCQTYPGLVVCTTICKKDGDCVYRSLDYGKTWECVLEDLHTGRMKFNAPYMKPEYNGGHSILHWCSDIKINPFCPEEAWMNSGTGVFATYNLLDEVVTFEDQCKGIEETVHLNVYGPTGGKNKVIDIVGDLGGFAFRDLHNPCENSFADEEGNRYITCMNADYLDDKPDTFIVTPRGNWTGKTKGGLIITRDGGDHFERLHNPFGLTEELDFLLHRIETPNINSGFVAMSPDEQNIVWTVAKGNKLFVENCVVSNDGGKSFQVSRIFDTCGNRIFKSEQQNSSTSFFENWFQDTGNRSGIKVFSDRLVSSLFYGFGENGQVYISKDGGKSFFQKAVRVQSLKDDLTVTYDASSFPKRNCAVVDTRSGAEIRPDNGRSGIFYMAMGQEGLWKLTYDEIEDQFLAMRLTAPGDQTYNIGLGADRSGAYLGADKTLYICGEIQGEYGFFRSENQGKEWLRINDANQMFGGIGSIDGDSTCFGRFYVASTSRGLLYGEPAK